MEDIHIRETPDPQTLQFIFPKNISKKPLEFKNSHQTHSPLLKTLLGFPWVKQIFVYQNFISLTKEDWVEWESLKPALFDLISEYKDKPFLSHSDSLQTSSNSSSDKSSQNQKDEKIKHIIETQIQPIVQRDGGFIQFSHYKNGNVYVHLKGACSGCPSAEWTLKQGVQRLLQEELPEIKNVISMD